MTRPRVSRQETHNTICNVKVCSSEAKSEERKKKKSNLRER